MKTGKLLRIGNKGEGKFVKIPFDEPETLEEFRSEFGDNEVFLVQSAMRGVRIRIQDLTRELVSEGLKEGKTAEQVQSEVLDWLSKNDITEKKERAAPGPRKPKEVVVDPAKKSYSQDDLRALLEANGIKMATAPAGEPQPA